MLSCLYSFKSHTISLDKRRCCDSCLVPVIEALFLYCEPVAMLIVFLQLKRTIKAEVPHLFAGCIVNALYIISDIIHVDRLSCVLYRYRVWQRL